MVKLLRFLARNFHKYIAPLLPPLSPSSLPAIDFSMLPRLLSLLVPPALPHCDCLLLQCSQSLCCSLSYVRLMMQHFGNGSNYFEIVIDVTQSAMAGSLVKLMIGYAKRLVLPLGICPSARLLLSVNIGANTCCAR